MNVLALQCPHCATRLRVRDQSFIGRTIHCPDCTRPLRITRGPEGEVQGEVVVEADSTAGPSGRAASAAARVPRSMAAWRTPRTVAWIAIVLLPVGLFLWARGGSEPAPAPPANPTLAGEAPPEVAPDTPAPPVAAAPPTAAPDAAAPEAAQRLKTLAGWVSDYRARHGVFPTENPRGAALPDGARLGWLAELSADRDPGGIQPLWDRPIDDALNGRFVRRRMPDLLNPLVREQAAGGYPATHFIGVAGVGEDAPLLPKGHLRAGIFGLQRSTRPDDVTDGLSHTLLLVGVERGLAPWAAGGRATIRGLTAEPYVRGPDGFGTGQPDGMFVAMADGSVRFLSVNTATVVIRRMAAIADGFPLDPAVPGEPGHSPPDPALAGPDRIPAAMPPVEPPKPPPAPTDLPDAPIPAVVARDPVVVPRPSFNVDRALQQPLRRFSQVRPARFLDVLRQVEEAAGVPIDVNGVADGPAAARLQREVSLELSNTTVGDVLAALVARVELGFEAGADYGIRLIVPNP